MAIKRQQGISLVPALFLMIVLAALGVVAVRLNAVQSQTVVLAMQSARAYAAARAGVEWSAYQALINSSCVSSALTLTEVGLAGFIVDTTCAVSTHAEGPATVRVYTIDAFARSGSYGTPDYVSRRIQSTITDAT
ncbi:MAG: pilus assembly protein MshP [Gammaproteobacteria bacterium]|nr:pilus assembly protein MshP [Gammaproteobacteria bacterium]